MVRRVDLQTQLLAVGASAVTVAGAIPINSIRGVYKLKLTEKSGSANKVYMDGVLGTTVTAVDRFSIGGNEIQEFPQEAVKEDTLPFWQFTEGSYDHIQFTSGAASVDILIEFADEHA